MSEDDALASVAVGLAADHKEKKQRGRADRAKAETPADDAGDETPGEVIQQADGDAILVDAEILREDAPTLGDRSAERLVNIAMDAEFETGSLVGDVRDTLLDLFRAQPRPWAQILEADQRQIADGLEHVAQVMVRKIVLIVAEDDAAGRTVHAKLESYSEKGGLKINLTASSDSDTVLALHEAVGHEVILKRADVNHYNGQRGQPPISPDQSDLLFEDEAEAEPPAPPLDDSDLAGAGMGFDDEANAVDHDFDPFANVKAEGEDSTARDGVEDELDAEDEA